VDGTVFDEKIQFYESRDRERIAKARTRPPEDDLPRNGRALETAGILADLRLDADTIIAALLLGGTKSAALSPSFREIAGQFGPGVLLLAEGVSKIGDISAKNKTMHEAENIRKMLFAMTTDIRVIFIKLADKLCALRNIDAHGTNGAEHAAAQECLDIYAPLADRLGISSIKDELEDLSLKCLNREVYQQIKDLVSAKRGERQAFLEKAQKEIRDAAAEAALNVEVNSRAKHFYSIYQKMRKRNKSAVDIFDLFGIRILCDSMENCYTLLGLVHRLWKPLEGRFKDYIAMPKANGYQSLHTTVIAGDDTNRTSEAGGAASGGEGRILEIQIRTAEMHHIAEYGLASHWLYKKGAAKELVRPRDISIVNRLKDWKQHENERDETGAAFLENIKEEILKDSIYVFTPRGKVIELPAGACALDFAYAIHSAVGEHCAGAKANGAIVPLSAELRNTQVVEILTSTTAHPNINWLRMVKTSKARGKIRSWLEQNDDSVVIEKNVVAKKKSPSEEVAEKGRKAAADKEAPPVQRVIQQHADEELLHVRVEDEKNLMIRFARCCRPVTGDAIIGYISRGRGIIIHRQSCSNLANIPDFEERRIEAAWENAAAVLVKRFKIDARRSPNLFSEIEGAVRKHQGHLIEGRLEETETNRLTGFFTMRLESSGDLKRVVKNIRGIPGVLGIQSLN
jgi:GTP pyrophosphokinase